MTRLSALLVLLALATIIAAFTIYSRDYARALDQCERTHTRETCIFILR